MKLKNAGDDGMHSLSVEKKLYSNMIKDNY